MNAQRIARLMIASGLMLLPAAAWAQNVESGTIAGVVKDTTGAVVPGVTVEAASPALIEKVRTVVTDDQGLYRIVDLRPGVYTVTFTLPGFSTFRREGLELTTAFTATVNAELKVGALEETVTVSGETPVVDIQNVMQQNVFSHDLVDALPVGNNVNLYATLVPGAVLSPTRQDVGGNQGEQDQGFVIHGTRQSDFQYLRDGMPFTSLLGSSNRLSSGNPAGTQEVVVQTSGVTAESETGGAQMNLVPKEGGNRFSGSFATDFGHPNLQGANVTDGLRARGVGAQPEIKMLHTFHGGLGGPIKQDKLWFFFSQYWFTTQSYLPGNYYNKRQGTLFYEPDLSRPAYTNDFYRESSLRLTWQASQKHKVNLTYTTGPVCNCFWGIQNGNFAPEATGDDFYGPNYRVQASWSYPATNRLLFEAGGTAVIGKIIRRLTGSTFDDIAVLDLSRDYRYNSSGTGFGITTSWGHQTTNQINQRLAMSYITGSHAFKTGLQVMQGFQVRTATFNRDVSYTFLNATTPQSITYWATPYVQNAQRRTFAIYAQDQWTIRKLTLNLGTRFDHLNGYVPENHLPAGRWISARDFSRVDDVPNWNDLHPRVGAAYDLFGNGKTALKVFLGRYALWETSATINANNPINASVNSATRTWNDANFDYVPQENELGPLSPAAFGQVRIVTRYGEDVLTGYGIRPLEWQGAVAIQHELRPGIALNVGYFRTWYTNFTVTDNLAVTPADYDRYCITAPRDARLPGGGGNQICGLYDIKPALFGVLDNLVTQASHYGKQTEVYEGVDVGLNARFGRGAVLSGGIGTGRTVTDRCAMAATVPELLLSTTAAISTTAAVATAAPQRFCKATLPFAAQTGVRFSLVYPLPWGLQPSVTFQNLPGVPITASYVATNAEIAPSLGRNLAAGVRGTATVQLIEPNTRFEPRRSQMDARLARIFRVGRTRVQGMIDVYNVFNASSVLALNTRYGPAWLNAQQILAARMLKLGAQLNF